MIVVDFLKLKVAEFDFELEIVKFLFYKKRLEMDLKKIQKVYPKAESIDDIQNEDVVKNHQTLTFLMERSARVATAKLEKYHEMRCDFTTGLFG